MIKEYLKDTDYLYLAKNLEDYLNKFKRGETIYPANFSKLHNYILKDVYKAFDELVKAKIVKIHLSLYCDSCKKEIISVSAINEIPENITCPDCGKLYNNPFDIAYVLYEKI